MKIILTGGGSGGHITPLLAVAHELKQRVPGIILIAVSEKNGHFSHLYDADNSIDLTYQIRAGKLRRYKGRSLISRVFDFKTFYLNVRDFFLTLNGYGQAKKLLKQLQPDGILIKGGFVSVPVGLAAARLKIPFITHDSDSTPGLANKIISRWAVLHATGMPAEFYDYPKDKTIYTGTPVAATFESLDDETRRKYRADLGLKECEQAITVIGGSQGAYEINKSVISIAGRLMQKYKKLGIIHIVGEAHIQDSERAYGKELLADELRRVVIKGFVNDAYKYMGAADVVVSRASATVIAELALQGQASILVPGLLAGGHQFKNAQSLAQDGLVENVPYGDTEALYEALDSLLGSLSRRHELALKLHGIAKPEAAVELAELIIGCFKKAENGGS